MRNLLRSIHRNQEGTTAVEFAIIAPVFILLVLHQDRVMESINRVLGAEFSLGPIGAGPGRKVAKVTANGTFGKVYGEALPDVVTRA